MSNDKQLEEAVAELDDYLTNLEGGEELTSDRSIASVLNAVFPDEVKRGCDDLFTSGKYEDYLFAIVDRTMGTDFWKELFDGKYDSELESGIRYVEGIGVGDKSRTDVTPTTTPVSAGSATYRPNLQTTNDYASVGYIENILKAYCTPAKSLLGEGRMHPDGIGQDGPTMYLSKELMKYLVDAQYSENGEHPLVRVLVNTPPAQLRQMLSLFEPRLNEHRFQQAFVEAVRRHAQAASHHAQLLQTFHQNLIR